MYNLKNVTTLDICLRTELLIKGKYRHHKVKKEKEGIRNPTAGATDRTA